MNFSRLGDRFAVKISLVHRDFFPSRVVSKFLCEPRIFILPARFFGIWSNFSEAARYFGSMFKSFFGSSNFLLSPAGFLWVWQDNLVYLIVNTFAGREWEKTEYGGNRHEWIERGGQPHEWDEHHREEWNQVERTAPEEEWRGYERTAEWKGEERDRRNWQGPGWVDRTPGAVVKRPGVPPVRVVKPPPPAPVPTVNKEEKVVVKEEVVVEPRKPVIVKPEIAETETKEEQVEGSPVKKQVESETLKRSADSPAEGAPEAKKACTPAPLEPLVPIEADDLSEISDDADEILNREDDVSIIEPIMF